MNSIKFRIAAKTDVGIVRTNNEDNFQATSDLTSKQMRWVNNEICSLGDKGALLVVADGMGGMNAGEVASEIAIETVRDYFSPENLTPEVTKSRFTIEKYMNDVIVAADARIKAEAKERPETRGMGTTIVIGWVLDGKLYISWCGDSRAYIYNPAAGLHQITKDHSYVQSLVDKGSITHEEAFDFPDSNIITRCLSDGSAKAKPESLLRPYELCDNDIIMLCTDGLSGMIRDSEIENIMRGNEHNMDTLVDTLIQAACDAEGSDNITICICQILQGGKVCDPDAFNESDRRLNGNRDNFIRTFINKTDDTPPRKSKIWIIVLSCLVLLLAVVGLWWFVLRDKGVQSSTEQSENKDNTEVSASPSDNMAKDVEGPAESQNKDDKAQPKEQKPAVNNGAKSSIFNKPAEKKVTEVEEQPVAPSEGEDDVLTPIDNIGGDLTSDDPAETDNAEDTQNYTVKSGDTYYGLSKKFNTTEDILQRLNKNAPLKAGAVIIVPKNKK